MKSLDLHLSVLLLRLRFDTCRVEMVLIQPHHVTKLIGVFRSPKNKKEFTKILQALHQMIKDSEKLADALGTSGNPNSDTLQAASVIIFSLVPTFKLNSPYVGHFCSKAHIST